MSPAMGAPQRRRPERRRGRAASDAERRALAKAGGRRSARAPRAPRPGFAVLATDGGSRGNPGPAAIGYVLSAADGTLLTAHGEAIGVAGDHGPEERARLARLVPASRPGPDPGDTPCGAPLFVSPVTGGGGPAHPRARPPRG